MAAGVADCAASAAGTEPRKARRDNTGQAEQSWPGSWSWAKSVLLFIDLTSVGHVGHGDGLARVVDYVDYPVITYPNAPQIFVAFQLFASWRPRIIGKGQNLAIDAGEQRIVQRVQLLLRGLFDVERVLRHWGGYVSAGSSGIARKGFPVPSGAIRSEERRVGKEGR